MKLSHIVTMLVGVFIIGLIAPLSQFLTIMTVNLDLETATPVGWAVGIVFSIALVMAVLRLIRPIAGKHSMVILYCMLSISVPVMNLGLVRPFFLSINAVHREYLQHGTSTYRTAYNVQNEDWFPLVPTKTGLAWNQADRMTRLLRDDEVIQEREEARGRVVAAIRLEAQRLFRTKQAEDALERAPTQEYIEELQALADDLSPGEARDILEAAEPEAAESLGLEEVLSRRAEQQQETPDDAETTDPQAELPQGTAEEPAEILGEPDGPEQPEGAAGRLLTALAEEAERLEAVRAGELAVEAEPTEEEIEQLVEDVETLGFDQIEAISEMVEESGDEGADAKMAEAVGSLTIADLLSSRYEQTMLVSEQTAEELPQILAQVSEFAISLLESNYEALDPDSQGRIDNTLEDLPEDHRSRLMAEKDMLKQREGELRGKVTDLSSSDYRDVVNTLMMRNLARFEEMDDADFDEVRNSFTYRLTRRERQSIFRQDGTGGRPDQNLAGFNDSLWRTLDEQRRRESAAWTENLEELRRDLPWHIWARPMIMWGLLFTCIFLFLMCLAEWLRRKWIERENLAFPLVDVADSIIRHDWEVELAIDPREPPKRQWAFNPIFLMGLGVGFIWIFAEAFGHYITGTEYVATYNISSEVFRTGALREMDGVQLVLSPIVIGIAFLVSLEISFSVWTIFFIYSAAVLTGQLAMEAVPQDSMYTGWAGGRHYPFPMEQMLGAVMAFSAVTLYKSFRLGRRIEQGATEYFIPRRLNRIGLIVLPAAILLLFWDMGFSPALTWFLLFFGLVVMAQTVATARVRAETGLPTHHASYEYTKFPMVFGLTGAMGAKGYALFTNLVFLPVTLLFRTLPQHLENIELARRNKLKYKVIAVAAVLGFLTALTVGMVSFIGFSYYYGSDFYAGADGDIHDDQGPTGSQGLAHYPLWVSHFLGEVGLDRFTEPHWIRIYFMIIGAGVLLVLTYLRNRFLRFPFHPLGYMLLLLSIYYEWVSPYFKGGEGIESETSWLWGSVLVAWAVKKLVVKYGGMFSYKRAKPFFIGLVVGAVMCVFLWNSIDLVASVSEAVFEDVPSWLVNPFVDQPPYSPSVY